MAQDRHRKGDNSGDIGAETAKSRATTVTGPYSGLAVDSTASRARLSAIRARLADVTPGPHVLFADLGGWIMAGKGARSIATVQRRADAEFLAAAPADVAWLCDTLEAALAGEPGGSR